MSTIRDEIVLTVSVPLRGKYRGEVSSVLEAAFIGARFRPLAG